MILFFIRKCYIYLLRFICSVLLILVIVLNGSLFRELVIILVVFRGYFKKWVDKKEF